MVGVAVLAAVAMLVQDVFGAAMVLLEAKEHGWVAGALDSGMWLFGILTTSISVTALQGHDTVEKVMVLGLVSVANVVGTRLGVWMGHLLNQRFDGQALALSAGSARLPAVTGTQSKGDTMSTKSNAINAAAVHIEAKLKVQASSLNATILAVVTALTGMVVGLGVINSAQEGMIIAVTTGGIGVSGLIANAIHTGSIEPSAVTTAVLAVVGQVVSLVVSFAWISNVTAGTVISITTAVVGAAAVIAHSLLSRQVAK